MSRVKHTLTIPEKALIYMMRNPGVRLTTPEVKEKFAPEAELDHVWRSMQRFVKLGVFAKSERQGRQPRAYWPGPEMTGAQE
jgi:hypothetical protein